jgi:hypothetical protein
MKLLAAIALIGMTSTPALAGGPVFRGHRSVHYEEYCYKNVEKYHPGYFNKHGQWVGGYVDNKRKRVACGRRYMPQTSPNTFPRYEEEHPNVGSVDENSCIEGSILGGIAGGGLGAALSRSDGRLWAIPLGIVGGAMAGCQVDGG